MSSMQVSSTIVGAVLLFWIVGAYNRLVGLRSAIVERFAPVDRQLIERHGLLGQQIDAIGAVLSQASERLDALRAATLQAETARLHARAHPGAPGAIKSLRVADAILAEARARLPVQAVGGVDFSELGARLAASDNALIYAQVQFNAAVQDYNTAVRQVPTRLIAGLFGFATAGTL
ncbi:MAG: LemA family protein [Caldimonas sp.]